MVKIPLPDFKKNGKRNRFETKVTYRAGVVELVDAEDSKNPKTVFESFFISVSY